MGEVEYMEADPEPEIIAEIETTDEPSTSGIDPTLAAALSSPGPSRANPSMKPATIGKSAKKKKGKGGRDSGTSSDEERWLDAIESGKLEEVDDELKKIKPKDPKLMTARQRAMYERNTDKDTTAAPEILMALPTGYKEKVLTAEAIQKAQLKSQKRKQLADEKREKDKKKTMERLLKKQESKAVKASKNRPAKTTIPMIKYVTTADSATISLPPGMDFPLQPQIGKEPPKPILCGMPNCSNLKRYNCSKTNVPLCSFRCYKMNVDSIKQIIC